MSKFSVNGDKYVETNRAKAVFDDIYQKPTPHGYFRQMSQLGYQIGEQARPYCIAAAQILREDAPAVPLQMLDVGCSFGVGSAFVRYGCSFEELVSFYESRAPEGFHQCAAAMRAWLNVVGPAFDMRVVGLDSSRNALKFACESGLLESGICRNLEEEDPDEEEKSWLAGCNLLISTGAIGYVGKPTFQRILQHLGKKHPGDSPPVSVLTVLRMFDVSMIARAYDEAGYIFERVPGVLLPQRAFADRTEKEQVVSRVREKGLNTAGREDDGVLYADLYVAACERVMPRLRQAMQNVRPEAPLFSRQVEVSRASSDI